MQPLLDPEGHGSNHNSYEVEDGLRATEATPLIRFPPQPRRLGARSLAVIGILATMLLVGIGISIYLLVVQYQAENVVPPVQPSLALAHAADEKAGGRNRIQSLKYVIVVQTDSGGCDGDVLCYDVLNDLQRGMGRPLPYNFMVSSGGQVFTGLGWNRISPMFPEYLTMVVAFIGNFTLTPPTSSQVEAALALFEEAIKLGFLNPDFRIIGKVTKDTPTYLFDTLQHLPIWDSALSDDY